VVVNFVLNLENFKTFFVEPGKTKPESPLSGTTPSSKIKTGFVVTNVAPTMLYELIAIVRTSRSLPAAFRDPQKDLNTVKEIVKTTGSIILNSGGAIRGIKNWGVFDLPRQTYKHQQSHTEGHYFVMRYDASSKTQDNVKTTLGLDPRMIKFSSVKLGDGKLQSISKISGKWAWNDSDSKNRQ